jgi:hypothetical protein
VRNQKISIIEYGKIYENWNSENENAIILIFQNVNISLLRCTQYIFSEVIFGVNYIKCYSKSGNYNRSKALIGFGPFDWNCIYNRIYIISTFGNTD